MIPVPRRTPQHPYNKASRAIPISYPGIVMLMANVDARRSKHDPSRPRAVRTLLVKES
jgi:hypothetical protein